MVYQRNEITAAIPKLSSRLGRLPVWVPSCCASGMRRWLCLSGWKVTGSWSEGRMSVTVLMTLQEKKKYGKLNLYAFASSALSRSHRFRSSHEAQENCTSSKCYFLCKRRIISVSHLYSNKAAVFLGDPIAVLLTSDVPSLVYFFFIVEVAWEEVPQKSKWKCRHGQWSPSGMTYGQAPTWQQLLITLNLHPKQELEDKWHGNRVDCDYCLVLFKKGMWEYRGYTSTWTYTVTEWSQTDLK